MATTRWRGCPIHRSRKVSASLVSSCSSSECSSQSVACMPCGDLQTSTEGSMVLLVMESELPALQRTQAAVHSESLRSIASHSRANSKWKVRQLALQLRLTSDKKHVKWLMSELQHPDVQRQERAYHEICRLVVSKPQVKDIVYSECGISIMPMERVGGVAVTPQLARKTYRSPSAAVYTGRRSSLPQKSEWLTS